MFKPYEAKPIIRMACEITGEHPVSSLGDSTYEYRDVKFKAYEWPQVGDYIVRLTEEDTYHCSLSVFLERNIVP